MAIGARLVSRACLVMVLAVTGTWLAFGQTAPGQPGSPTVPAKPSAKNNQSQSKEPLRSPLLQGLHDAVDKMETSDNEFGGRDDLKNGLREADQIMDRIRRENRRSLASASRQPPVVQQPNIILVVVDELPLDHLGCYGQEAIKTPNIDRLAAHGTKFTQFRTGTGELSARWSLLTGRSLRADQPQVLRPGEMTLAQALWRAGYSTAWIGDCSLKTANTVLTPSDLGFEYWYGSRDSKSNYYPERLTRGGQAVDVAENSSGKHGMYINDVYTQHASAWIHALRQGRADRPFFLMVSYRVPARDWQAPDGDAYADQNWSDSSKSWASMVTGVDHGIGNLIAALRDAKQLNSTIIVVTADQRRAAAEGDQAFATEQSEPEENTEAAKQGDRVPLIIYGHGRVAADLIADDPATMADLPPTLAALARFSKGTTGFDGASLGDVLLSKPAATAVTPKVTETPAEKPAEKPADPPTATRPARKLPQIIRGRP